LLTADGSKEGRSVPRYFLPILVLDGSLIADREDFDLPDLDAARREALGGAGEILAHAIRQGRDLKDEAILITGEQGQELDRVGFIDAIPASLRCLIPRFDGAVFSSVWRDSLWARFFTGAPARQRRSVARSSMVQRA
jgi:hypothetical protein